MSHSERFLEVERLYHAALERPPQERASFLDEACAHDTALRRELESLLEHDQPDGHDFLDRPAVEMAALMLNVSEGEGAIQSGSEIGNYRIIEQIARGGMGVVYRAEQQHPVRRVVALKVIKPGMDSEQVVARFEAERQALALMDHPNIARVLDAGTTSSGRLFFVMELVDGLPVTEYCAKHRLDPRERLELFIPVCHAIQHAHQKGVIHRDIKPSNVLVTEYDGKAVPKVIDFGIAKAMHNPLTERSMHTQMGAVIGTPLYMSPEQAGSFGDDIDTRSDLYSLGAVLYELITGSTPLSRASFENTSDLEMIRRVREEDLKPPSARLKDPKLIRAVRGDLDWVIMRALEKDRTRRYETVNGLARELQRFLAGEPVEAAPPSVTYRMLKFARRHRMGLLTATGFAILLMAGVVTTSWMAIRATRAEQESVAITNFLQNDLLAQASTFSQSGRSTKPDPDLKVRTALDRAAVRASGKFDHQPEIEAGIRETIGQAYFDLALYKEAGNQLRKARDLLRRERGEENPQTMRVMSRLGLLAYFQGKIAEAETLLNRTSTLQRRRLGPENPDTLFSMNNLAVVYNAEGKYAQAEALYRTTIDASRRVLGPEHPDTLRLMNGLCTALRVEGKYAEAEELDAETLKLRRRVLGPEHPDTLRSMNNYALVEFGLGKYAEAEALFSQAVDSSRRVLGPTHPDLLVRMSNLVLVYAAEGKYPQAERLALETLDLQRRVIGPEHPDTLMTMTYLAAVYGDEGKYGQAEGLFRQTIDIKKRVLRLDHPSTLYTLSGLAFVYQQEDKFALAEALAKEVYDARRRSLGSEDPATMLSSADLALAYVSQGKFVESEPLVRQALEFHRKAGTDDWRKFFAETLLGESLAGQKKYDPAEASLTEGYRGMADRKDRMGAPNVYYLDRAREWIIQLYADRGKPLEAAAYRK